ncbi:hypothetical protein ACWEQ8_10720 [Streptomyces noursei]
MDEIYGYQPSQPSNTPLYDAVVRELGEPWVGELILDELVEYEQHLGYLPRQRSPQEGN